MNTKSLVVTILVAAFAVWLTDFLIHAVWLSATYGATKELWRPEADMLTKMPFMLAGQIVIGSVFAILFALFVAEKRCLKSSLIFAGWMGITAAAGQVIMYAVAPYPGSLVIKWCVAYIAQALLLGLIVHFVYRPPAAK